MSIRKENLKHDLHVFSCDIATLQRTACSLQKRIDRLPNEPKHEWKVGQWRYCAASTPGCETKKIERLSQLCEHCVPIPAPLFEVGEKVKHSTWNMSGKIVKRYWVTAKEIDCKPRWCYDLNDNSGYKGFYEENLTRVAHEWKVGQWFFDKDRGAIFRVDEIRGAVIVSNYDSHRASACIPVHFIQKEGDTIGEGSIVMTPDGWIGSVLVHSKEESGEWFVDGHGRKGLRGFFIAAKLTLCAPEVK